MPPEGKVKDIDITMVRKTEVADASFFALFHQPVENSIVDVAMVEFSHAVYADSYAVQQQVIHIVHLQFAKGILEHFDGGFPAPRRRREIGQFSGNEIFRTVVAMQGYAGGPFRPSLAIGRRCVNVIQAMFQSIVYLTVYHFLVNIRIRMVAFGSAAYHRQTHHSVTED